MWDNRSDTATLRNDRGRFIDNESWGHTATATATATTTATATDRSHTAPVTSEHPTHA